MPVDTTEHTQGLRAPYTAESLRVRCPHCRKLYLVQLGDIREAKPRFECVQCHDRFWISLGEMDLSSELTGLPVQVKEIPQPLPVVPAKIPVSQATEPCPRCFKLVPVGARECGHCGVMISKARVGLDFHEPLPAHSTTLDLAWKRVVDDYENDNVHQEFLRQAQREYNIAYAAAQYGQMAKLMPTDAITRKRVNEVQALGSVMLPPRPERRKARFGYARLWQVPFFGAILLILIGIFIPFFRNLVGVGAAFLFLALALRR